MMSEKVKKITAAVLVNINTPIQIKQLNVPELKEGQVLIKLAYSGLCHSQLMEVRGKRGQDKYLPHLLGHEGVGRVIAIGEGVSKVHKGDRVVLGWIKGDGLESNGQTYQSVDGETINAGAVTTFSDYAVVSENRVVLCPKEISSKVAVLFGCALPTGAGMVLNELKPEAESSVIVLGLGGIGLSALIALNEFKLANIIAVDIEPEKLVLAKKLGATHTFLSNADGIEHYKQEFPEGVDYALESAGLCKTIELAFSLIKKQGLCLFASHPAFGEKISLDPHELICGKTIKGSWGGNSFPDIDIPKLAKIITKNNLPVDLLLSDTYSLMDINQALTDLEQRKIVRALISFPKSDL
jgi:S-(hydroxymethyl)glutathione dehydrogenase/alcohol dehydrogenase